MKAVQHTDPAEFWQLAGPVYRADPLRNTFALTVIRGLIAEPGRREPAPLLVTFDQDGDTVGAAFCTPPWPVNVSAVPANGIPELVRLLQGTDFPVAGVIGPLEPADRFADAWTAATGHTRDRAFKLRLHRLDELVPSEREVRGAARPATDADVPLLATWQEAFGHEAGHMTEELDHAALIRRSLAGGNTQQLWEVDGTPVACAGASKPADGMSRVGPVYTPPEHRGHGYGSAATAAATQWALDQGAEHVILFTDLANPTSNAIYRRLGYRPHHEAADYRFTR